jgi:subtilisin family serine protease
MAAVLAIWAVDGGAAGAAYPDGAASAAPAHPSQVVPNNPCYGSSCGPTSPVVVYNPVLGAGLTTVHPDGQTNLWAVNAAQAWAITKGSASIFVAVLDTGVDPRQAQLEQKVVVGPNVCQQDRPGCAGLYDENGHGTFVTGLIAADTNDGTGIAGLGWNTKVIDIKVLDSSGTGDFPDEVTGIHDAIETPGVRVINLSWTDFPCGPRVSPSACGPDTAEQDAVESAIAHGAVVVAAAGNYATDLPVYPGDYPGVLSVAASTDQGVVDPENGGSSEDFSDAGNDANIAAPGIFVLSTWYDGDYAVGSGTSFAAPLVSAAAALVMAADPGLAGPQVSTLLVQTASPLASGGVSINGGLLNVAAAVQAASSRQVPITLDGYQLVASNGTAYNSGFVADQEPSTGARTPGAVVSAAELPSGLGYWMVTANGSIIAVGGAHDYGPASSAHLGQPVVGMVATPDGHGYWLAGQHGSVTAFGDAHNYGSANSHLSKPIVGIAATPDGRGYWLVSSDGGVFAFGDARYYGSMAKIHLHKPIAGIASTPDGHGYWLVGSDGGIFNFGDAGWYGPAAGHMPDQPIVGMAASPDGRGYWLAGRGGRVWDFGSADYELAEPSSTPSAPIIAISS